jgi:hypothetical protein
MSATQEEIEASLAPARPVMSRGKAFLLVVVFCAILCAPLAIHGLFF